MLKSIFLFSYSGCLIPLLLVLNFLFGGLFLKFKHWLLLEAILFLLFLLNTFLFSRKIFSAVSRPRHSDVIDVEGEIVEEEHKPKAIKGKQP